MAETPSTPSGPAMSPFNDWVFSKSLERHCQNALVLAEFLEQHPEVDTVHYPHLSSHPQYELAKKQMRIRHWHNPLSGIPRKH